MIAVTTFGPDGFHKYAKRCLETLAQHFPGRVIAYCEEYPEALPEIEFRDFFAIPNVNAWLDRVKRHPGSDGQGPDGYNFRYNAQKFCRKVFAQDDVFDEDEYVFWIDADSFAKQDIPEDFLRSIFDGTALAFLGRNTYTETGFIGFHTKHPDFPKFRAEYLPWIKTGRIFSQLKGWHDCIAFDHARHGIPANNLSPKGRNYDAVMEQSVLHPYLTHLKGHRKYEDEGPKIRWA